MTASTVDGSDFGNDLIELLFHFDLKVLHAMLRPRIPLTIPLPPPLVAAIVLEPA